MKDAGFEYLPEYFADTPSLLLEIGDRFTADPYTGAELTPDTYASEHGLGIVAHYEANRDGTAIHVMPSERANQRYWRTLTTDQRTEFNEALHGGRPPDTSSCLAQAEAGLWAFTITDLGSGPTAVDQTMDIVSAIPEVAAALDSWQECMGDRGIDVVDPDDAFESFASRVQPEADTSPGALDQLRADEVTFAIAHRACDASSGLSDAFAAEFEREWNVAFGNP